MAIGRFYGGVAAVIWSSTTRQYLLLRRSDQKDYAPGIWECVTGRVDQGEGFEDALRREVHEELDSEIKIEYILGTTHFYRGNTSPENELIGVVYLCSLPDPTAIQISEEHAEYRWLTAEQAFELLSTTDPSHQWARGVIQRAEEIRPLIPEKLVEHHEKSGFEFG
jgi:8-oxo-dGTP diphosphatase